AAVNGGAAQGFDAPVERVAALLGQHLADQRAQTPDIVAQGGIGVGKADLAQDVAVSVALRARIDVRLVVAHAAKPTTIARDPAGTSPTRGWRYTARQRTRKSAYALDPCPAGRVLRFCHRRRQRGAAGAGARRLRRLAGGTADRASPAAGQGGTRARPGGSTEAAGQSVAHGRRANDHSAGRLGAAAHYQRSGAR